MNKKPTVIPPGNAPLTPLGRAQTVHSVISQGLTLRAAAAARGVSEKSVRRWVKYSIEQNHPARLYERSFVPLRQPKKTTRALEKQVIKLRRKRMSYTQITMLVPVCRSTIFRILKRHRLSRLKQLDPAPTPIIRYEREKPGEIIHLDIKKLGRFTKPGVRGTGNRADRNEGAGNESLHVAIDDHSRLGCACLFKDETIPSVIAALTKCSLFTHQIKVTGVMTDNGSSYRSHLFVHACTKLGIRHRFTRPYRSQTNGKRSGLSRLSLANGPMVSATAPAATETPHSSLASINITSTALFCTQLRPSHLTPFSCG